MMPGSYSYRGLYFSGVIPTKDCIISISSFVSSYKRIRVPQTGEGTDVVGSLPCPTSPPRNQLTSWGVRNFWVEIINFLGTYSMEKNWMNFIQPSNANCATIHHSKIPPSHQPALLTPIPQGWNHKTILLQPYFVREKFKLYEGEKKCLR